MDLSSFGFVTWLRWHWFGEVELQSGVGFSGIGMGEVELQSCKIFYGISGEVELLYGIAFYGIFGFIVLEAWSGTGCYAAASGCGGVSRTVWCIKKT